jgi:hypothetical protein
MDDILDRSGAYYSTELLDDIRQYKYVSDDEIAFLLKLNLLFFDSLCQGAFSLLSHPLLHRLSRNEPEAMRELYGSKAIVPIVSMDRRTLGEVAKSVVADPGALQWLSADDIHEHADFIDRAKPTTLTDDLKDIRAEQFQVLHGALEALASKVRRPKFLQKQLPTATSARWFLKWLEQQPEERLRISSLHRHLDGAPGAPPTRAKAHIRGIALAAHADIMRRGHSTAISSFDEFSAYFAFLRTLHDEAVGEADGAKPGPEHQSTVLSTRLPFADVASLPLRDVVWLRTQDNFRRARRLLRQYRPGATKGDVKELSACLEDCSANVERFLSRTPESRERLKAIMKADKRSSRIRFVANVGLGVVIQIFGSHVAGAIWTLFQPLAKELIGKFFAPSRSALYGDGRTRNLSRTKRGYDPVQGQSKK